MSQIKTENIPSKYYHFSFCDGLAALTATNHKTPFPAHFHPTFNITLVYEGIFKSKIQNQVLLAPSGIIQITNPEEIHANPFTKDSNVSFFTFYISSSFIAYCNGGKPVFFEQKVINDAGLFCKLHNISLKLSAGSDFLLLEDELRLAFEILTKQYSIGRVVEEGREQLLFTELLDDDYFEKFSLADAARNFGIDKYKFLRLFKDQTGLTPNNYFIYKRIEKSKTMLAEGRDLLSVAIDLGFYDAAHYANHFKKFTGVTPMNFKPGK